MTPIRRIKRTPGRQRFGKVGTLPKTIRPTEDEPLRLQPGFGPDPKDEIVEYRRGVTYASGEREQLEKRAVSDERVKGSIWERIVYLSLLKRHIPFDFQSSWEGGRLELGGLVADFVLLDRPLIVQIHGTFWHEGVFARARDREQNDLLRGYGFDVEELWDHTIRHEQPYEEWLRRHIDQPIPGEVPEIAMRFTGERR